MAKRMYAVARELKTDCRSLIRMARKFGMEFRSHMSVVSDAEEMNIKQAFKVKTTPPLSRTVSVIAPKQESKPSGKVAGKHLDRDKTKTPAATATPDGGRPASPHPAELGEAEVLFSGVITKPAAPPPPAAVAAPAPSDVVDEEEDTARGKGKGKGKGKGQRGNDRSRNGQEESFDRGRSGKTPARHGRQRFQIIRSQPQNKPKQPVERKAEVQMPVTVKGLCALFGEKSDTLIKKLFEMGKMKRINDFLSREEVEELAIELGVETVVKDEQDAALQQEQRLIELHDRHASTEEKLATRPPVVTMLGHVDHGKTSLLDRIRETDVASTEAGGITQHIGAFHVRLRDGRAVTFLDTPGHEAFTAMRARGAQTTDIAILVVAGDDGVMPTTLEAIDHARAAKVPIVVALNKMDRPEADANRVKGQLAHAGLTPSGDWGGNTDVVETAAHPTRPKGIEELLETILLQADVMELRANPTKPARGTVIEAKKDPREGISVTVLVQDGTLRVGDIAIAGKGMGKVRFMYDDKGKQIKEAGPSVPVKVFGIDLVPTPGDKFYVTNDLAETRRIAEMRERTEKIRELAAEQTRADRTAETLLGRISESKITEVGVIIKTDTQGSAEVLAAQVNKLSGEDVRVKVIRCAVGPVSESDVQLAMATAKESLTVILGFHVMADQRAHTLAEAEGIQIRTFRVIYELTDFLKRILEGQLEPEQVEVKLGQAEVRNLFSIKRINIAGCMVIQGTIARNARIRIYREGREISPAAGYEVGSLRRHKDDVREVREGMECGIVVANFNDVKEGDILEFFRVEEKQRKLT